MAKETTERRDAEEVRRILESWLSARLPGSVLEHLRVTAPSGHGFSNDTFLVDAVVDGTAMPLALQAAPTGPALFPEYRIDRMAAIQCDLRDHSDVPIANVRWYEDDASVLGAPFYVMDKVEGRVPDESPKPYHAAGWVLEATPDERRRLWMSVLDAMGRLHRLDVATHFDYLTTTRWGMPLDADPASERVRQWRDFTVWACEADELPASLMDAWDALAKALPPRPERLSIAWGDAKLGNVMFDGFDVVALFDWELCAVGPAEEDLMNQLAVDQVLANVCRVPRLDGFPSPAETIAVYEEILGRDLVGTAWWYAFALAKMAAEVHRIMRQWRKLGAVPAAVDLEAVNTAIPVLLMALEAL